MSSKTLIVAQREYLENLRTKTFWIGIFSLPVIFALFIFVGRILERSKDVRAYAVLDLSEGDWLSAAVDAHAARSDLLTLGKAVSEGSDEDKAKARQQIHDWYATLDPDHPLKELERRLEPYVDAFSPEGALGGSDDDWMGNLPPEARREVRLWSLSVATDPEKAAQLGALASSIALARYRRVPLAALGVDSDDDPDAAIKELNQAINSGRLFAYFVIPAEPVGTAAGAKYVSNNLTDNDLRKWFEGHATEVVRERRVAALNLTQEQARSIQARFEFQEQKVSATGETTEVGTAEKASSFAPVAFVYLLWIAVFMAAQMLLTNTVEEKSNRLIEVLLSSVSPLQLMAGKVLGIAATGLTIVICWVLTAVVGAQLIPESSPLGGANLGAIIGDPLYLTSFVAYFVAGYLLYAAILVALGSVCDSLKEAQNLMQPVFILLMVPLVAMVFVVQDPNGTVARVLTYVPLYTPFLMMNRAGGPPPAWEYVASTIVIVVSLIIAFWAAGKIFRIGILMTGKPPRIREILHWLRAPIGAVQIAAVRRDPDAPAA